MHHLQFLLFFYDSIVFVLDCNQPTLIGDGYCNDEVNILDCGFDGGDCCGSCINTDLCTNCSCLGSITGNGVPNALVGDGYCNDETNTQQCNFDGGDCCGSCIISDFCTNCSCIGGITGNDVVNARVDALVGDGFCHDMMNNPGCNYDHGDCCLSNVKTNHCTDCTCHLLETCAAGFLPPSVGDGYCNDNTNNVECGYDHGDCCFSNVITDYCMNCTCHLLETCVAGYHPSVGNGFCDDETNIVHCNYDGLDCCRSEINTANCAECSCHGKLVICRMIFALMH